ncbi:MAG TPA: polynucleotide 5'-hydroxyl-kinase [Azospirillaceae bacterium]|nr:polynucleotide 5'-hydroxyl-kinase [Azospirillaceae bacterium]
MDTPGPRNRVDVPADWAAAAARLTKGGALRVLVLGPADSGKTTVCTLLLSIASDRGRSAVLVDADVGQKMSGPPACVTLGRTPGQAMPDALWFVGTTDPVHGWDRTVAGLGRLGRHTTADLVLANTGGLLAGPGRRLKAAKIRAFGPDLLLALGAGPDLDLILADHPHIPALRLAPSAQARRKTPGERRQARQAAFARYFADATTWTFPGMPPGTPAVPVPGLLVGLADHAGRDIGMGIASGLDPVSGTVALRTPVPARMVDRLSWGAIHLDAVFRETRPARPPASAPPTTER